MSASNGCGFIHQQKAAIICASLEDLASRTQMFDFAMSIYPCRTFRGFSVVLDLSPVRSLDLSCDSQIDDMSAPPKAIRVS